MHSNIYLYHPWKLSNINLILNVRLEVLKLLKNINPTQRAIDNWENLGTGYIKW